MEEQEIHDLVFGYDRGVVVGVRLGDSWESVKENVRPGWTVREEPGIHQFRKDWDLGNDMMMVTFELNSENQVDGMNFNMTAMPNNYPQLDLLKKKFISDFNLITVSKQVNDWDWYSANDELYTIVITQAEPNSGRKSFEITISK